MPCPKWITAEQRPLLSFFNLILLKKMEQGVSTDNNIAILKSEIEFLKQEITVLKALCQDFRMTMEAQDEKKREALREQLSREPKTRFSQATEMCLARYNCGPHQWERILHSGKEPRKYSQCRFCGEEQINNLVFLCFFKCQRASHKFFSCLAWAFQV